ncbi:MAG: exopolyphosphatase [Lachnospiraceae bacterium]|nr:exopolyphosphatase [Lachnospiraceae bacterium]
MKKLFAAIDVGSYELCMKVFELGGKTGIKEIDCIRHRIDIGNDTFHDHMIGREKMDELCDILKGFHRAMDTYRVNDYLAYGTSAFRETANTEAVLDQIERRTGIRISVLSNSEQRFLEYKGAALKSGFERYIKTGTAFVDIGGGSSQITLFDMGHLVTTVNLHLGTLRIRTKLRDMEPVYSDYETIIGEMVDNEIDYFRELYLGDIAVENIIIIDDYMSALMTSYGNREEGHLTAREYKDIMQALTVKAPYQIAAKLHIPEDNASMLLPSAILVDRIINMTGAKDLYLPGVSLSDGIAYDYADRKNYIRPIHDFGDDILSSAANIAAKYGSFDIITSKLTDAALIIFDATKKIHGMGARERTLLNISGIMRNVGKYVSMSVPAETSHAIIKDSEIMGVSHRERIMIATIVQNSYPNNISYDAFNNPEFESKDRITVIKLTAILRVATGLAKNVDKTMTGITAVLKDKELTIKVTSKDRMLLEKGLFSERTDTFEEIFGITPKLLVIKHSE